MSPKSDEKNKALRLVMGNYWRDLTKHVRKQIIKKYKSLREKEASGLFTPNIRKNLMRLKPVKEVKYTNEYIYELWSTIGKLVPNGLADLQLLAETATNKEMKNMFSPFVWDEKFNKEELHKTDIPRLVKSILHPDLKMAKEFTREVNKTDIIWRYELIREILKSCEGFLDRYHMSPSPTYQKPLEELINALSNELYIMDKSKDENIKTSGL